MQSIAPTPIKLTLSSKLAYSIREACAVLSLGKTTIFSLIKDGKIRAVRIGGRTLIPAESLRALLDGEAEQ